jgi:uncharacterized membrane protein
MREAGLEGRQGVGGEPSVLVSSTRSAKPIWAAATRFSFSWRSAWTASTTTRMPSSS